MGLSLIFNAAFFAAFGVVGRVAASTIQPQVLCGSVDNIPLEFTNIAVVDQHSYKIIHNQTPLVAFMGVTDREHHRTHGTAIAVGGTFRSAIHEEIEGSFLAYQGASSILQLLYDLETIRDLFASKNYLLQSLVVFRAEPRKVSEYDRYHWPWLQNDSPDRMFSYGQICLKLGQVAGNMFHSLRQEHHQLRHVASLTESIPAVQIMYGSNVSG